MMIRPLIALIAALPSVAAAADRSFLVTDFDRVRVEGPFEVQLATGRAPSAKVSGGLHEVDAVEVRSDNRTLVVRSRGVSGDADTPTVIRLSTHEVSNLLLIGAGSLTVDRVKAGAAHIVVDGAGSVEIGSVEVGELSAQTRGSARLALAGQARSVTLTVSGDGNISAPALQAGEARIANNGSGSIALTAVRTAEVKQTGTGRVTVYGSPACTIVSRGNGVVTCRSPRLPQQAATAAPAPPVPQPAWAGALQAPVGRPGPAARR